MNKPTAAHPLRTYMVTMQSETGLIERHPCDATDMEAAAHIVTHEHSTKTFVEVNYTH